MFLLIKYLSQTNFKVKITVFISSGIIVLQDLIHSSLVTLTCQFLGVFFLDFGCDMEGNIETI